MKTNSILASLLVLSLTFGCSESTPKSEKEVAETEKTEETTSDDEPTEINVTSDPSLNGTYSNESGKVIITNYIAEKGFDFKVILKSPEDCAGINYEGKAIFDRDDHAISGEDTFERDEFTFNGKNLKFEPNIVMTGMECSRFVDIEFEKN